MLLIRNLIKKKIKEDFLRSAGKEALRGAKLSGNIEISLVICGEKRIRTLNRVWRGKNRSTDVLSFSGKEAQKGFKPAPDRIVHLGEIFICYPIAEKQARQYGYSAKEEMARLLIHGILHLAGYDHEKTKKEEKKMVELQEKIIGKILNK